MTASARTLVLLRHAKAASPDDYAADIDRPLTARGRRDASAAGAWLAAESLVPDLVLCSPSVRTRETWEATGLPDAAVSVEHRLYSGGTAEALRLIRAVEPTVGTLLVVGHNPTITTLSELLDPRDAELRTAGLAVHLLDGEWSDVGPGAAPLVREHTARG
jgi:phosphohistidine phosphatase